VATPKLDDILAALSAEGLRTTVQRRVVITALLAGPRHVTAEDLTATVQAEHPDIAKSTVYRILEALEHQGVVQHAHMGHGPAVYHLSNDDHLHLVCEACGKVTEVPQAAYARFARMLADNYGFSASPHHFAVHGRCSTCTTTPALPHSGSRGVVRRRNDVRHGPAATTRRASR